MHYLHCPSGYLITKHDGVNKQCGLATKRACGGTIEWEVPGVFAILRGGKIHGGKKRSDFNHTHSSAPCPTAFDTSVTSPVCDSYVDAAQTQCGAAAVRAAAKIKKHGDGAAFNGVAFVPLAFEVYGAYCKEASTWLMGLCALLGDQTEEDKFTAEQLAFLDTTRRSISVVLQRGNAQTIIRRAHRDRMASAGTW